MKILVEATFFKFQFITGIERHFFSQLEIFDKSELFDTIYIVVTNKIPGQYLNINTPYEIIFIDTNSEKNWADIYAKYNFDILYSTFEPPALLPDNTIPTVHVLHDPGRYIFPKLMEPETLSAHMQHFQNSIAQKNFYIITVSESSRIDIIKLFPTIKAKVFVVYNFVPTHFNEEKIPLMSPFEKIKLNNFFLAIGRYIPTKNTVSVLKSFQQRSGIFKQFQLVIIGRKGWYREFDDYVEQSEIENVLLFDSVSDSNLKWLYKNCYGLINASIYEGFGLPLIEASVCGCHRIFCSSLPVFKEILPDATCFFNPLEQSDILEKVFLSTYTKKDFSVIIGDRFSIENSIIQFKAIIKTIFTNEAGHTIKT